MAGDYYSHSNFPQTNTRASSALMRAELDKIETGFDKLPNLPGNGAEIVTIKADATGLESKTPAELHLARDDGDAYTGTHDFTGATVQLSAATGATQLASDNSTKLATTAFVNAVSFNAALPAQTVGDAGKFIQTDGVNASWQNQVTDNVGEGRLLLTGSGDIVTLGSSVYQRPGISYPYNAATHDLAAIAAAIPIAPIYWSSAVTGVTSSIDSLAYKDGVYLAAGQYFTLRSTDGANWTEYRYAEANSTRYQNSKFISACNYGSIRHSADGVTWAEVIVASASINFNDMCYGGGTYVVVGTGGSIYSSTDLIAWTTRSSGVTTDLQGVCYDTTLALFCAVGNSGVILTSPSGAAWTPRTSGTVGLLIAVDANNLGTFVAAEQGTTKPCFYSTNGITWSNSGGTMSNANNIRYVNATWIEVGSAGLISTSPNGLSFTGRTSNTAQHLYDVAYVGGTYIAVGSGDAKTSSLDFTTWVADIVFQTGLIHRTCAFGNSTLVVSGSVTVTSASTSGFTLRTSAHGGGVPAKVRAVNGYFVRPLQSGVIAYSTDALTWSYASVVSGNTTLHDIAWSAADAAYAMVAGNSTVYTSATLNGVWATNAASGALNAITYSTGLDLFVAVGNTGVITTSPSGATWTPRTSGVTTPFNDIAYRVSDNTLLVAGRSSTDGVNWVAATTGTSVYQFATDGSVFLMPTSSGSSTTVTESTGATAVNRYIGTTAQILGAGYGGGKWFVFGQNGVLRYNTTYIGDPVAIFAEAASSTLGIHTKYTRVK